MSIRGMIRFGMGGVVALCAASSGAGPMGPGGFGGSMGDGPRGSLAIRAVQGTAGAPQPTGNTVEVYFFHQNQPVHRVEATLDAMGLVMIGDLPVGMTLRPLVRIDHTGVVYQEAGPILDATHPSAAMEVVVYETTEREPAWRVATRQVVVAAGEGRVVVSESVFVENPADRTWLGHDLGDHESRTTVRLLLPAEAGNIQLVNGFHGWCCTGFEGETLSVRMPLMPGRAVFEFSYEVSASADGSATLALGALAPTDELAVIVPETGITAEAEGLSAGSVQISPQGPMRLYVGRSVGVEDRPRIRLAGLGTPGLSGGFDPHVASGSGGSWWRGISVGWIGVGVVGVLGLAAVVMAVRRSG